ncbi:MAG TPA: hypothetical protein PKA28_16655 [Methylomusa anaerophila]|nr:hypothetical protein [Methylomusa anaerophila]
MTYINRFYVGVHNYYVEIENRNNNLYEAFCYYLGEFYGVSTRLEYSSQVFATVCYDSDQDLYDYSSEKYKSYLDRDIILRKGEYSDNFVTGKYGYYNKLRIVYVEQSGSIFEIDDLKREIKVINPNPEKCSKEIVLFVRNQLLIEYMEKQGALVLHAAAITNGTGDGALILGQSGDGKTTTLLSAMSNKYYAYSFENTLLFPQNNRSKIYSIPTQIRILPGILLRFQQTQKQVEKKEESGCWTKRNKVTFQWRDIFKLFNLAPKFNDVYLRKIIIVKYDKEIDKLTTKVVDNVDKIRIIDSFVLTMRELEERPRWLGWFYPNIDYKYYDHLDDIDFILIKWSEIDHLNKFFKYDIFNSHIRA